MIDDLQVDQDHPLYKALCQMFDKAYDEDRNMRLKRIQRWIQHDLAWRGIESWWNELTGSFQLPPEEYQDELPKIINIFKGHGETIISALTAAIPYVRFYPDDADLPDDISTAHAYSRISEIVQKNNQARLKLIKAIFVLYQQDFVASYTYKETDKKYGTVKTPQIGMREEMVNSGACVDCGNPAMPNEMGDQMGMDNEQSTCPNCGSPNIMNTSTPQQVPFVETYIEEEKSKTCIDVEMPLYIKIPYFARKAEDIIYLIKSSEDHYATLRKDHPEFREDIQPGIDYSEYETYARLETRDYFESNITTTYKAWFKPAYYETLSVEDRDSMLAQFPEGVKACFIGSKASKLLVSAEEEDLDKHWSIYWRGTSEFLHDEPLGSSLIPIQEIRNDLTNLTLETIKHGIPQTFANPDTLNFDQYNEQEIKPGMVTPAVPPPGKSLGDGFYEVKTSTLSQEVQFFFQQVDSDGQFVVGSFPSVYGGPQEGGGTLGEYEMSRNQALQRLNLTWGGVSMWWAMTMKRATKIYAGAMLEDERDVQKRQSSFINVWVRRAEMQGKVGRVEAESSDQLPISQAQKIALLMRLIELNNDQFNEVVFSSENSEFVYDALGYPDLVIPDAQQRAKQYEEIQELLIGQPIETGDEMMPYLPSVDIDFDIDDNGVHKEVLEAFLIGEVGRDAKKSNPAGYLNCIAHYRIHDQAEKQKEQQIAMQQQSLLPPPPQQNPKAMEKVNAR